MSCASPALSCGIAATSTETGPMLRSPAMRAAGESKERENSAVASAQTGESAMRSMRRWRSACGRSASGSRELTQAERLTAMEKSVLAASASPLRSCAAALIATSSARPCGLSERW